MVTTQNTRVAILGASGMLGSMVLDYFARQPSVDLLATVRSKNLLERFAQKLPNVRWTVLDAERATVEDLTALLGDVQWVINAIGVIKPYIHDDNPVEVERAVRVNALFPYSLAKAAENVGCTVLQIATDCVFSGRKGHYVESDEHDPLDAYGKTKSLGEVHSPRVHHLRCSIIGPEPRMHVSLLDWFLRQPHGAKINGFLNHQWNGVTTLHFAKLCLGVIRAELSLGYVQHVVPADTVSKAALLECFAQAFKRRDITVTPVQAPLSIDRTLATENESLNLMLWQGAGYQRPPSIASMVEELASFDFRFGEL